MSEDFISEDDQEFKRVTDAARDLNEHFDTVQIFVTRHAPEHDQGTVNISWGAGNWFARYGQISDWTVRLEARARRNATMDE